MTPFPQKAQSTTDAVEPALSPLERLRLCLSQIKAGPWRFIQLRGEPIDERRIDGDDVDLLGARESVNMLCDAACRWVQAGHAHLRVNARKPGKVEWWLFSTDGLHVARFDLWIELNQLDRGRLAIRHEDVAALVESPTGAIGRLPPAVEAGLYVHHLLCKRKDLAGESAQARLARYADELRKMNDAAMADAIGAIRESKRIAADQEAMALQRIVAALPQGTRLARARRGPLQWMGKLRSAWLAPPKRTSMISVMGCDGAGKTTLAHAVAPLLPQPATVFTGKHLYRKSILYKLAVIFIRPLLMRSRESFDETLAPLVYLRASLGLGIAHHRKGRAAGLTLIDRSPVDFLYVNRKTDEPRFSRWSWLSRCFGRRIRTVHCLVRFENVMKRKQEMTMTGHAAYDRDMFTHFTRQTPTDYIAFNNDGSVDESAQALAQLLQLAEKGS